MIDWFARRLKLGPDETRRALALGLVHFALIASYTLVKTVRDAYFLSELPVALLPYVFLGVAVLTGMASLVVGRLGQGRPTWQSLAGGAIVAAVLLVVFGRLIDGGPPWMAAAFYFWVNVYGLILLVQFWAFANALSHAREAKRTFGIVGVGGILGGLAGGVVATPMSQRLTLGAVLAVAAAALVVMAVWAWRVSRDHRTEAPAATEPEAEELARNPLRHGYVRWLALAALCSVMVASLIDYQFKAELQRRYTTSAALASFLGLFYTFTNLGALTVQLFATRPLIQRFGAGWSAAVLPIGLTAGATATLLVPGFAAVTFGRSWDLVMRLSINRAAGELFYFPLEPGLRRRVRSLIVAVIERIGEGVTGLLLLGIGLAFGLGTRTLAIVLLVLIVVWVLAWLRVRRGYVVELGANLRRLSLEHEQMRVSLREASVLREMSTLLGSRYERIVIHGIEMLEENDPETLERKIESLLDHASPRVRARALAVVAERHVDRVLDRVTALTRDEDPEVRVQAINAHSQFAEDDPIEPMIDYLGAPEPRIRGAAIHAIVQHARPDQEPRVAWILEERLAGRDRADRLAVAEALGRRAAPSMLHDLVGPLLSDPDLAVRCAALRSAGAAQRRGHVQPLIEALGVRSTEDAARSGLVALGDRVVGTLGDWLIDRSVPIEVRHCIPRALGEIPTQESVNALFRHREHGDLRLSYRVLKAANQLRAAGAPVRFPRALVREDIAYDSAAYMFAFVHYRACPIGHDARSAERLLCIALNERMEQALNRVFRRLALVYPPKEIFAAYQGINSDDARRRGDALEYLENALASAHAELVLPMVDDAGDEARVAVAAARWDVRMSSYEKTLEAIVAHDDSWLRACALYAIGARRDRSFLPLVRTYRDTVDAIVRETALWAETSLARA